MSKKSSSKKTEINNNQAQHPFRNFPVAILKQLCIPESRALARTCRPVWQATCAILGATTREQSENCLSFVWTFCNISLSLVLSIVIFSLSKVEVNWLNWDKHQVISDVIEIIWYEDGWVQSMASSNQTISNNQGVCCTCLCLKTMRLNWTHCPLHYFLWCLVSLITKIWQVWLFLSRPAWQKSMAKSRFITPMLRQHNWNVQCFTSETTGACASLSWQLQLTFLVW